MPPRCSLGISTLCLPWIASRSSLQDAELFDVDAESSSGQFALTLAFGF